MDTKLLRQKILDLAIRGKLVPQDPNDEPASVLLERIKAEKEQLIKEGKIKPSKKTATTSDSRHYPFDLPSGWVWTTLGELFTLQAGKNISAKEISIVQNKQNNYPCFGGNGIRGYVTSFNISGSHPIIGRQGALCGNINLATNEFYATEHAVVVDFYCETDLMWCYYTLKALNLNQYATATAQPGLAVKVINEAFIPLPPYKEQRKISNAISHWFSLIDDVNSSKVQLKNAISQVKSKILNLAIHGKLVSQDPADEPASELLKRVNPSAEITCDNEHYPQLPNGWILLKGKYVFNPLKSTKPKTDIFKYIDIDSIDNKKQCVRQIKKLAASTAPSRASRYTRKGDVLFAMVRPYLKNIAIVPESDCIASTGFYICSSNGIITTDYCYYLMSSDYVINGLNQYMKGDNSPSISKNDIENWEFPIPPINEQIRITESIKILFSKIDNIAENL